MREQTLRDFLVGDVTLAELMRDLQGAIVQTGQDTYQHPIIDMAEGFTVRPEHLIRLCDAVLEGGLSASSLEPIGFCLLASDRFDWADAEGSEVIVETLNDWASPQANYPLTKTTVAKFRHRLLTGEDTFTKADTRSASA